MVYRFCFGGDSRALLKNAFLGAYTVVEERRPWKAGELGQRALQVSFLTVTGWNELAWLPFLFL